LRLLEICRMAENYRRAQGDVSQGSQRLAEDTRETGFEKMESRSGFARKVA